MNKRDLAKVKSQLLAEKEAIITKGIKDLSKDTDLDTNVFPDELDCANTEYQNYFSLRIRDREQFYLRKIDRALAKMETGKFGVCEECEDGISVSRLKARPVTTLCIRCKEEQEIEERSRNE